MGGVVSGRGRTVNDINIIYSCVKFSETIDLQRILQRKTFYFLSKNHLNKFQNIRK